MDNYILPYFKNYLLADILVSDIVRFQMSLHDKGLSNKMNNEIIGCLRIMLGEAVKRGLLATNYTSTVDKYPVERKNQLIYTLEEVRDLFAPKNWELEQYRICNLTAAATGLRQGEILGLVWDKVHYDRMEISHSWGDSDSAQ